MGCSYEDMNFCRIVVQLFSETTEVVVTMNETIKKKKKPSTRTLAVCMYPSIQKPGD